VNKDQSGAPARIDAHIASIKDWRGKIFAQVRKAILSADREIVEEWKWMGSPVWSRDGMIAVANAHKGKVKVTFAHGAALKDPDKLFNAGNGNTRREIDLFEGDKVDGAALKRLVQAAIEFNHTRLKKNLKKKSPVRARAKPGAAKKKRRSAASRA
jgi:hypothetical protein